MTGSAIINKNRRRLEITIGLIVVIIAGLIIYNLGRDKVGSPKKTGHIATIRLEEVIKAHPDYAELKKLKGEELKLELDIDSYLTLPAVDTPSTDKKPFDDSVWQKNAQEVISERIALERRRKELKEEYRKATEAGYIERRQQLEEEYLNDILNFNLKLDNQRAMHGLRVTEEELRLEREKWQNELATLKQERLARHVQLYRNWQAEIDAMVAATMAPEEAAWQAKVEQTVEEQKDLAEKLKTEVEIRNKEAVERIANSDKADDIMQKRLELDNLKQSIATLETHIMNDVRSRGTKLALQHKIELILIYRAVDIGEMAVSEPFYVYREPQVIMDSNTIDLTAEFIKEIQGN